MVLPDFRTKVNESGEDLDFAFANRVVSGSDRTRFLAQGGGYDADRMAHWPPFKAIQLFTKRVKEGSACLSNTAADDHDLGIESIYERRDRSREVMDRTKPDLCGLAVATKMRFDKQTRRGEPACRALRYVVVADHLLETSRRVDDIRTAIGVNGYVTEMTRASDVTRHPS